MINGTFWNVPNIVVTNDKVAYLNEIQMPYVVTLAGISKMQFSLKAVLAKEVSLLVNSGEGEFFSDSAGMLSLGQKITYASGSAGGTKTVYYKSTKSGTFTFRGGSEITGFGIGGDWAGTNLFLDNTSNARVSGFDISQLAICTGLSKFNFADNYCKGDVSVFESLTQLNMITLGDNATFGKLTGSTSSFANLNLLTVLRVDGMTDFDVKNLPSSIVSLQTSSATVNLLNTGTANIPALNRQITFFSLRATNRLSAASTDSLLQALANSLLAKTVTTTLTISGTRTSTSDAAIATLTQKMYQVSLV